MKKIHVFSTYLYNRYMPDRFKKMEKQFKVEIE